jgi:hypothetical protein
MRNFRRNAVTDAAMWLSTGAAICIAIFLTERIIPLWFFLMPIIGGYAMRSAEVKATQDTDIDARY